MWIVPLKECTVLAPALARYESSSQRGLHVGIPYTIPIKEKIYRKIYINPKQSLNQAPTLPKQSALNPCHKDASSTTHVHMRVP